LTQDAVIRNLQAPTESRKYLSNDIKDTEAQIPWREINRFRNVIAHGSLGINLRAFGLFIEQDLP
jgi:uncharacterized protein with HEPN domain